MSDRLAAKLSGLLVFLAFTVLGPAPPAAPEGPVQKLAEGVYLFTKGSHRSLFVVTPAGVVVTDPQSPHAAVEYLQQIRQITSQPVKYVIYSHRHSDHIAGGEVFSGTAVFISHEVAQRRLLAERKPGVVIPSVAFKDRLTLVLGGRRIDVLYLGKSETDDNVFIFLPKEKILFAVDSIANRGLPWGFMDDGYPLEWIETLKRVEALDFEVLALGHGEPGTKKTVREYRGYLTDLIRGVDALMVRGLDLDEIKKKFRLPKYRDWRFYDVHFSPNVDRVYEVLLSQPNKKKP
ncbi:MAG: MBL fold metallo-hydrolase [Nitrospinota bacterium]